MKDILFDVIAPVWPGLHLSTAHTISQNMNQERVGNEILPRGASDIHDMSMKFLYTHENIPNK